MKNITKIVVLTLIITSLLSCRDESLNPLLPIKAKIGLVKANVTLPGEDTILEISEGSQVIIDYYLEDPEGNVDSYTLKGNLRVYGEWSGYTDFITITEFPAQITITADEMAEYFGYDVASDIPNYSWFNLMGTSMSEGYLVDAEAVEGEGFSEADNPDGVASGLISGYIERSHRLKFIY